MASIISRSDWTNTPASGRALGKPSGGVVLHYPAAGRALGVLSRDQERARIADYRKFHRSGRGWSDIGYNYAIGQSGRIYELRGWRVGAHATGNNSTSVGVLFLVGNDEELTPEAKAAAAAFVKWARSRGAGKQVRGHQQMPGASTACPGQPIMRAIRDGSILSGGGGKAPAPSKPAPSKPAPAGKAPAFPLPRGSYFGPRSGPASSVSGYYSNRDDLRRWQERMKARGWKIGTDGLYGPETEGVARAFQKEKGLAVDGKIGPATWAAAWTAPVS